MDKLALAADGFHVDPSTLLGQRPEEKCPFTAVSCRDQEDACCIPDMGRMTLALQWVLNRDIEKFTLHGFWPGDCTTGISPEAGCGTGYTNTRRDIDSHPELKEQMDKYWVSDQNSNQRLWDHEWNKHGTCLSTVRDVCPLGREEGPPHIRYFKASLREYEQFDVYEELKKNGVIPRLEPYPRKDIEKALKKWDMTYRLQCIKGRLNQIFFFRLGKAGNEFISRPQYGDHQCPFKIKYYPKLTDLDASGNPVTPAPPTTLSPEDVNAGGEVTESPSHDNGSL